MNIITYIDTSSNAIFGLILNSAAQAGILPSAFFCSRSFLKHPELYQFHQASCVQDSTKLKARVLVGIPFSTSGAAHPRPTKIYRYCTA